MVLMLVVLFCRCRQPFGFLGDVTDSDSRLSHLRRKQTMVTLKSTWESSNDGSPRGFRLMMRYHRAVCILCLVGLAFFAIGIPKIRTSVDLLKLFDGKTRILADYHWLEENLGNLVPLEILVRFNGRAIGDGDSTVKDGELTMLGRVQVIDEVRKAIDSRFGDRGEQLISTPMSGASVLARIAQQQSRHQRNRSTSGVRCQVA